MDDSQINARPHCGLRITLRHPLVERIRELLLPPSPVSYVHDPEQPISGVLSKPEPMVFRITACEKPVKLQQPPKQQLGVLNMQASGLLTRRRNC